MSAMCKKNRDDLAKELAELEQQRSALSQEVLLNTTDTSGGQFSCMQSFKVRHFFSNLNMTYSNSSFQSILDQFETSVKCEEADTAKLHAAASRS